MISSVLRGAAAGAAGTTALNAATYLDMAVRGRPTSSTPEQVVERLTGAVGVRVPGDEQHHDARVSGLGALSGIGVGVGVGAAYGALRGAGWSPSLPAAGAALTLGALLGSNGPMTVLGITDPRTWSRADWLSDMLPHLAYGAVAAAAYGARDQSRLGWRTLG